SEGYFGVLPGHAPLVATLHVGEMWYRTGQDTHYLSIAFGFVEVLPDRVTVLAQIAERAEDIDIGPGEAAVTRAEQRIKMPTVEIVCERARDALEKSRPRVQVAG